MKTYLVSILHDHENAVNGGTPTWINYVPKSLNVNGHLFKFIHNESASTDPYSETGVNTNADFFIQTEYGRPVQTEAAWILGDRIVTVKRDYKPLTLAKHFKAGKKAGFEVLLPISYGSTTTMYTDGHLKVPSNVTHVIGKPMGGARGTSQCIIPIDQYDAFIANRNIPVEELETRYPDIKFFWSKEHKNEDGTFKEGVKGFFQSAFMLVPYVPNVDMEFRVLRGGDVLHAYIRTVGDINGEQRVITSDKLVIDDDVYPDYEQDELDLEDDLGVDIMPRIKQFLDDSGFYYGSVDFYVRSDDSNSSEVSKPIIGIFESCVQHGTTLQRRVVKQRLAEGYLRHLCKNWLQLVDNE